MGKWDALIKGALLHDIGKVVYRANQALHHTLRVGQTLLNPIFLIWI